MGERITLDGSPQVELQLKRSARARRLSLRVSRLDGRVTLTIPKGASRRHALAFAAEKAEWIRKQLAAQPAELRPMPGDVVPFRGDDTPIVTHERRSVHFEQGSIAVPAGDRERTPARLAAFFKTHARTALAEAVARHEATLGKVHGRLSLRDTRSRWGSCSARGDLMFSWRLIMAPPEVLDYVTAHEVAHLVEMNHSAAFWALVEELHPGHRLQRRWLHENAPALHRFRFRD